MQAVPLRHFAFALDWDMRLSRMPKTLASSGALRLCPGANSAKKIAVPGEIAGH
jgi:hypothetical protein